MPDLTTPATGGNPDAALWPQAEDLDTRLRQHAMGLSVIVGEQLAALARAADAYRALAGEDAPALIAWLAIADVRGRAAAAVEKANGGDAITLNRELQHQIEVQNERLRECDTTIRELTEELKTTSDVFVHDRRERDGLRSQVAQLTAERDAHARAAETLRAELAQQREATARVEAEQRRAQAQADLARDTAPVATTAEQRDRQVWDVLAISQGDPLTASAIMEATRLSKVRVNESLRRLVDGDHARVVTERAGPRGATYEVVPEALGPGREHQTDERQAAAERESADSSEDDPPAPEHEISTPASSPPASDGGASASASPRDPAASATDDDVFDDVDPGGLSVMPERDAGGLTAAAEATVAALPPDEYVRQFREGSDPPPPQPAGEFAVDGEEEVEVRDSILAERSGFEAVRASALDPDAEDSEDSEDSGLTDDEPLSPPSPRVAREEARAKAEAARPRPREPTRTERVDTEVRKHLSDGSTWTVRGIAQAIYRQQNDVVDSLRRIGAKNIEGGLWKLEREAATT